MLRLASRYVHHHGTRRCLHPTVLTGTTITYYDTLPTTISTILISARMASQHEGLQENKVERVEKVAEGRWLTLQNFHWSDHTGRKRVWEVAGRRKVGGNETGQDSVAVAALVTHKGHTTQSIVLVKQFRPPLRAYTIELPAGLIDGGETALQTAIRELKEETGLTGQASHQSETGRVVALDPGISSSTMSIIMLQVDGDSVENQEVSQVCGVEGERTEVFTIPLSDLGARLSEFAADGCIVDSRVEAYSLGLSIAAR